MDDSLFNFILDLLHMSICVVGGFGGFGLGYGYAQRQQRLEIEKETEELYKDALRSYPSKNSGNIR